MTWLHSLRRSAMDLLSAAAFLGVWLLRDRFDYDTLRSLLLWPVVFALLVALALFLAGMLDSIRSHLLRSLWFLLVGAGCLAAAFLIGASAGMPQAGSIALWLLAARLVPPRGVRLGSAPHRAWVYLGAGYSGLLWGAGFVATVVLMLLFSSEAVIDANGERRSTSPAWIFPLVWTPYFIAEAIVRARRAPPRAEPGPDRIRSA
jgi:hypothetical protein